MNGFVHSILARHTAPEMNVKPRPRSRFEPVAPAFGQGIEQKPKAPEWNIRALEAPSEDRFSKRPAPAFRPNPFEEDRSQNPSFASPAFSQPTSDTPAGQTPSRLTPAADADPYVPPTIPVRPPGEQSAQKKITPQLGESKPSADPGKPKPDADEVKAKTYPDESHSVGSPDGPVVVWEEKRGAYQIPEPPSREKVDGQAPVVSDQRMPAVAPVGESALAREFQLPPTSPASSAAVTHIKVTIGRIDVRAMVKAPSPPKQQPGLPKPKMSLEDYLKKQNGNAK